MNRSVRPAPASVLVIGHPDDALPAAVRAAWPGAEVEGARDAAEARRILTAWVPEVLVAPFPVPGGALASLDPSGSSLCIALVGDVTDELAALTEGAQELIESPSPAELRRAHGRARARAQGAGPVARGELLRPLIHGIAHEINNPLTVLQTGLELLRGPVSAGAAPAARTAAADEETAERAEVVQHGQEVAARIAVVTRRLLSLLRLAEARPRDAPAGPALRRAAERAAAAAGVGLPELRGATSAVLRISPYCLEEAAYELLFNACLASPAPGSVWVDVAVEGDRVELRVRDAGGGLPEDIEAQLFLPFQTTRGPGQGLGLGLARVAAAAQTCGGSVRYARTATGSCFTLVVPRGVDGAPPPDDEARAALRPGGLPRVLVLDETPARLDHRVARLHGRCRTVPMLGLTAGRTLIGHDDDFDVVLIGVEHDAPGAAAFLAELRATRPALHARAVVSAGPEALEHPALGAAGVPLVPDGRCRELLTGPAGVLRLPGGISPLPRSTGASGSRDQGPPPLRPA
jgi:signal transduction histidine kinase